MMHIMPSEYDRNLFYLRHGRYNHNDYKYNICEYSFEYVPLSVNLPRVYFIGKCHNNESVKYNG